jgi:hypothetical protein
MVSHRSLLIAVLLASPALADDQSLMACSEIAQDTDRLNCFDQLVADLKDSLNTPQKGTRSERIEARSIEIQTAILGAKKVEEISKNAPEAVGVKIVKVEKTPTRKTIYTADAGDRYLKLSTKGSNFREGDTVILEDGVFGSLFMVGKNGLRIKVRAL